jgi:hypothetical protein
VKVARGELQVTGDAGGARVQIGRAVVDFDEAQLRWLAFLALPAVLASQERVAAAEAVEAA